MKLWKLLPVAALAATGLTVSAPAQAAPQQTTATCTLAVPARVSVAASYNQFTARLGAGCSADIYTAVWKSSPAMTPQPQGRLEFRYGNRAAQFGFYGYGSTPPIGTISWQPAGGATNINGTKIADLAPASTVPAVRRWLR